MVKKETVKTDTESRILQAAEEEFLLKGLEGARTTAIAERAGVTHSIHQQEVWLKEGRHTLTLMDEEGHILQQVFRVVGKEIPGGG